MSDGTPRRGSGKNLGGRLEDAAQTAGNHPALEKAARAGYAVNGLLHLVIAWICLQLAMLRPTGDADQSGALATLASTGAGLLALWLGVVGFAGLCLWQLTEVLVPGLAGDSWQSRAKDAAKAVIYLVLAVSCFGFATGEHSSGKNRIRDLTTALMRGFGGRLLVAIIGLAIIGVGIYHVVKGLRKKFLADNERDPGPLAVYAGMLGYPTRGVALGVVGLLFVLAAIDNSTAQASGLDAAFRFVLEQPYGRVLVGFMALGFAAFGIYLFFRARHADV
ncbi:DUF1206 domain-containing protein [Arsenicicoccus sp. oral taxon 190]|uniref:DUF1206 domain-containing protein n=1 Tax=Arsenicicoccus sp. oral taxon 190 TaxID=1658671 RepID=UPI00067A13AB|nr:DUF1206 domain-containing protein [Arsenicicoccus sp. oral taxon 190]AKT52881.1 hypothetical protein ADJ73_14170 [Arsenicicoccus sp. oral taxon 190]